MANKIKAPKSYRANRMFKKSSPKVGFPMAGDIEVRSRQAFERTKDPEYKKATANVFTGKLFLDDERQTPEGWNRAYNIVDFLAMLDTFGSEIEELSLDWYLGHNVPSGLDVVKEIMNRFTADSQYLPKLWLITFHSSDITKSGEMYDVVKERLPRDRFENISLDINPRN